MTITTEAPIVRGTPLRLSTAGGASEPVLIDLDAIRTDGGTQARAGLDDATVAEYAATWQDLSYQQNGLSKIPPIVLYHDGESYWLADGFHRVEAYKRFLAAVPLTAAPRALLADVQSGTRRDAVLYTCGANAGHGLRRTNADKRRAVERLLKDEEWRQWSNREIARRCNVSDMLVATIRRDLYPQVLEDTRTVARNGTTYQQKPPARPLAPAPPADDLHHLPPDFTDAQRRAETIGLMLSMDMEGRFAVRDPATGVGLVGFRDWTAVLAHLGKMEEAAAKRDRIVALVAAERESDAHVDEIKRLCAISGSRYIGVATDRGVADGTRYRIALFGGGGGDYLADEAVATLRAICDRRASAAAPPAPILPTPAVDWLNQVAPLTDLVTELCEAADWSDRAGVIRAALRLASAAAGDRLEDLAEQLDDAEYEALAAYRRDRSVVEESEVGT